ncbi:MAG: hypothetical protein EPN72_06240 [Nevskiaceae bacterium]|nr:MAG: hypothetical protein EPN63_02955 [Nevskiaceae bacterium]TBR73727.1 MAG: hypothetical protein EPN72_06240 [Nevskiaceae bacterium]
MRIGSGIPVMAGAAALAMAGLMPAHAFDLYKSGGLTLNGDFSAALGVINSERSYSSIGVLSEPGKRTWFEGLGTYGISGNYQLGHNDGTIFGAFDLFSGADRGGYNAAGITTGHEYQTQIQNAYLGWKSGDTMPWLGHDGLQISAGRQTFQLGTGFLIGGDKISLGKGLNSVPGLGAPGGIERAGGTYYLGSLASFGKTAILELGGAEGFHFKGFWLSSDNKYQGEEGLTGGNLEYRDAQYGTLGATYIRGLSVSHVMDAIGFGRPYREGRNIGSIYGNTSLGIKQLAIAGQYVRESKGYQEAGYPDGRGHAWYASVGWTFDKIPWTPALTYRFSRFSKTYDPMYYGFTSFGTWFQGEVAANYAGPFSAAADIQMVNLTANPSPNLVLGTYYSHFGNIPSGTPKLQGNEVDAYAEWTVFTHYTIIPLMGYYKPKYSAADGGTQLGSNGPNIYSELILFVSF